MARDLAAQAFGAGPEEGEEAFGRQHRFVRWVGESSFSKKRNKDSVSQRGETLAAPANPLRLEKVLLF
jgi:hypothetical protein